LDTVFILKTYFKFSCFIRFLYYSLQVGLLLLWANLIRHFTFIDEDFGPCLIVLELFFKLIEFIQEVVPFATTGVVTGFLAPVLPLSVRVFGGGSFLMGAQNLVLLWTTPTSAFLRKLAFNRTSRALLALSIIESCKATSIVLRAVELESVSFLFGHLRG